MKIVTAIVRFLVGLLFIVSGLVKANDPLGLSYKMQEFFEVWNADLAKSHFFLKNFFISSFHFFNDHSLALAVVMIGLEIMAGLALWLGWRKNFVLGLLVTLIVFFTFLTGYAYVSGKFKNCGCFGDCLPITPLTSFIKDVVLLLAILFLIFAARYIQPIVHRRIQYAVLSMGILISFGFQWYCLTYLPVVDCLPYKKGADIATQMKIPPNAVPDSFAIRFVYKKDNKQFEFSPESLPADLGTYTYVDRKDQLIRKGNAEPAIKGFVLTGVTNEDSTQVVLNDPKAVLFFYDYNNKSDAAAKTLSALYKAAWEKQKVPVYVITTSIEKVMTAFAAQNMPGVQYFNVDYTAFRTAARTNPCIYYLQKGRIVNKWSAQQTGSAINSINNTFNH